MDYEEFLEKIKEEQLIVMSNDKKHYIEYMSHKISEDSLNILFYGWRKKEYSFLVNDIQYVSIHQNYKKQLKKEVAEKLISDLETLNIYKEV